MNTNKVITKFYFGDVKQEFSAVVKKGCFELSTNERIKTKDIYFMEQIHSDIVVNLDDYTTFKDNIIKDCDALITTKLNTYLAVKSADCFPIFLYDSSRNIISAIHSGCEGTRLKIVGNVVNIMYERYKSIPEDIRMEIGAGICMDHYQVSADISATFRQAFQNIEIGEYLDLRKFIINTAMQNGILQKNIIYKNECTYESNNYFSFRRNKTQKRQLSIIGMCNG